MAWPPKRQLPHRVVAQVRLALALVLPPRCYVAMAFAAVRIALGSSAVVNHHISARRRPRSTD